jgi:uncharacterized protein (TIGR02270 family)
LPDVVVEHVVETAFLWESRTQRVSGAHPQYRLHDIAELDARVSAHLEGLTVAGEGGWSHVQAALEAPTSGVIFAAAVCSLQARRSDRLNRLFASVEPMPDLLPSLVSAHGWTDGDQLRGLLLPLLESPEAIRRRVGLAVCAVHRVDPGIAAGPWIRDRSADVRARALRSVAELGRLELLPMCAAAITDDENACAFWSTWSAVLLGNRGVALEALTAAGLAPGSQRVRAFRLAIQAITGSAAHDVLQSLARAPGDRRWLIQGSGIAGDPAYVPWLISHMSGEETARLAGEAFSLITGNDLALLDLERRPPENFESGPNDDPDDPNVDMDPDDGLPWPDPVLIENWWAANSHRFEPGTRYFMGAPVTREHCIEVLKNGYQRQRILAAHYLCLLNPGTPLFNTSAPAWRQQRLLAQM